MRVVIITDFSYINGGSGKVAIESAIGLAGRGYDITVVAAYGPTGKELLAEPRINVVNVHEGSFNKNLGIKHLGGYIWSKQSADAVREVLKQYSPKDTAVHIHSFKDAHSPSVCKVPQDLGFKVLFTSHDFTMFCPYVGLFDLAGLKICERKPMSWDCISYNCQGTSLLRKQVNVARFAALTKIAKYPDKVDYMICGGDHSSHVIRKYLDKSVPLEVVEYPLKEPKEPRIEAEKNSLFGFVGRLSVEKDPVTAAIAARLADVPFRFVGEGPMEDRIRAENKDAEITGWVPGTEVPKHLQQFRCNLLPSIWLETRGLGILEGVTHGIPCIVSEVCAASQTVDDFKCGLKHKPNDPEDLAEKMRQMKDDETVKTFSIDGYNAYWENPLTMERHLDALENIYRLLIDKANGITKS